MGCARLLHLDGAFPRLAVHLPAPGANYEHRLAIALGRRQNDLARE